MDEKDKIDDLKDKLSDANINISEDQIKTLYENQNRLPDVISTLYFIKNNYRDRIMLIKLSAIVNIIDGLIGLIISPLIGILLLLINLIATRVALFVSEKELVKAKQHLADIGFPIDTIRRMQSQTK